LPNETFALSVCTTSSRIVKVQIFDILKKFDFSAAAEEWTKKVFFLHFYDRRRHVGHNCRFQHFSNSRLNFRWENWSLRAGRSML
jgi:hypothetical protein